jgi:hypothetical protein
VGTSHFIFTPSILAFILAREVAASNSVFEQRGFQAHVRRVFIHSPRSHCLLRSRQKVVKGLNSLFLEDLSNDISSKTSHNGRLAAVRVGISGVLLRQISSAAMLRPPGLFELGASGRSD